jgi:hypothetical protein
MYFSNQCPKLMEGTCIYLCTKKCEYIDEKNQALGANIKHVTWIKCDIRFDAITRECIVGNFLLLTDLNWLTLKLSFLHNIFKERKLTKWSK